jgi:hypothetical protein
MGSAQQRRVRRAGIVFASMLMVATTMGIGGTALAGTGGNECRGAGCVRGGTFSGTGSGSQRQSNEAAGFTACNGQYSRWYGSGIGHTWYDCTAG